MDPKELSDYRGKLWNDLFSGIIPDRVPIEFWVSTETYAEYAGLPIGKTLWTQEGVEEAYMKMASQMKADTLPKNSSAPPIFSTMSGCRGQVMGSSGFMQHPEIHCMEPEEYDEYIDSPYDFILGKVIPRLYGAMTDEDPARWMAVFYMATVAKNQVMAKYGQIWGKVSQKLGFYSMPGYYASRSLAPMDLLSDYIRGFTGISMDIRRHGDKVAAAAMANVPMLVKYAKPAVKSHLGSAWMPGHMPTFMRPKDFEKCYHPSFSKLIHATAENGQAFKIFCEDNWTRYLDYLQDLPQGTRLVVEKGDPKEWKDKLGDKMILTGFYPIMLLKSGTKEQCVDKAKELVDILAPGGNYYFGFDKTIITLNSIVPENLFAVCDYVAENTKYANAGEKSFKLNTEDTIHKCLDTIPEFKAKYYKGKEDYMQGDYILPDCKEIMASQAAAQEDAFFKLILGNI